MKKAASNSFRVIVSAACLALVVLAHRAEAGIVTWDPQAANPQNPFTGSLTGSWETANWDTTDQLGIASPSAWVESSTALFAVNTGTGTPPFTVTMNSAHTVAGIINGGQTPGPCSVTINGTGTMTLPSGVQTFNIVSPGTVTISNVVAGAGSLVESGSGALTLFGVNTYTGGTAISGALTIGNAGKLGNGTYSPSITNGGIFTYNSSAAQTLSGIMTGTGMLVQSGASTLTMTKANTFSGGTTIAHGSTLTLGTGGTLNGNGVITNNGTFNYNNAASWTLNGVVSGSGSFSVNPSGAQGSILTLNGANTYTGATTVALAGQVVIDSDSSLGTPPATFTASQLVLNFGFLKANGTFTLNSNRGITMGSGQAFGAFQVGASIQVNPNDTLTIAAPITGPSSFISGSGEVTFGYGTNLLTANSTYTGATGISTGCLMLGINGALPFGRALVISADQRFVGVPGAIFDMNGFNQTIGPLSSTNTFFPTAGIGNATPTILLSGALTVLQTNIATVFSGMLTGSGSLTINGNASGTLSLSNYANAYTGGTIINGGTLDISTGSSSISGDVTVNGGTLELDNAAALSTTSTLAITNGVTVNLNYSGTQTVAVLDFGATPQATGVWGAVGNPSATFTDSRFTGSGLLLVCPAPQTITPATASVCAGSTTTASVPVTPAATYAWTVANGNIVSGGSSSTVTYTATANSPITLNCVVTSACGVQSPGNQNVMVPVDICGLIVQASNHVVFDSVNGATITGTGVLGANWLLNASTNVNAPLPWATIQSGTVSQSPFTVTDPNAINVPRQFYYLTNSN